MVQYKAPRGELEDSQLFDSIEIHQGVGDALDLHKPCFEGPKAYSPRSIHGTMAAFTSNLMPSIVSGLAACQRRLCPAQHNHLSAVAGDAGTHRSHLRRVRLMLPLTAARPGVPDAPNAFIMRLLGSHPALRLRGHSLLARRPQQKLGTH